MKSSGVYVELVNLGIYFGEDFDLWGRTVPEVMAFYRKTRETSAHARLLVEIDRLLTERAGDLDKAFAEIYGSSFDPILWGYTPAAFLKEVKKLLKA